MRTGLATFSLIAVLGGYGTGCKQRQTGDSDVRATTMLSYKSEDLTTFRNAGGITALEQDALKKYTSEYKTNNGQPYWTRLNNALRTQNRTEINNYEGIIKNAASLINKVRNGSCNFYRFLDADQTLINQLRYANRTYIELGFFSSTENNFAPAGFQNKAYVINGTSSNCARISSYSVFAGEREVLFPPGTEFTVTRDMSGRNFFLRENTPGQAKSPASVPGSITNPKTDEINKKLDAIFAKIHAVKLVDDAVSESGSNVVDTSAPAGAAQSVAADPASLVCSLQQLQKVDTAALADAGIDPSNIDGIDFTAVSQADLSRIFDLLFMESHLATIDKYTSSSDPALASSADALDSFQNIAGLLPAFRKTSECDSKGTCGCAAQ